MRFLNHSIKFKFILSLGTFFVYQRFLYLLWRKRKLLINCPLDELEICFVWPNPLDILKVLETVAFESVEFPFGHIYAEADIKDCLRYFSHSDNTHWN